MELLEWWNLIFVLPFLGALFYLVLQASGMLAWEGAEADADADVGVDLDAGVDADLDADIDTDLSVDADVPADVDVDAGHADLNHSLFDHGADDPGGVMKALTFLGVGRVPLSMILMSFCFLWGFAGWSMNLVLEPVFREPAFFVWISIGAAMLISLLLTRLLVRGLSYISPTTESYDTSPRDLLGRVASSVYPVTESSGSARLRDSYGNLQEVAVRVEQDAQPLPAGSSLILWRYDPLKRAFIVRRDPLQDSALARPEDARDVEEGKE